jgi:hypothetical protein
MIALYIVGHKVLAKDYFLQSRALQLHSHDIYYVMICLLFIALLVVYCSIESRKKNKYF